MKPGEERKIRFLLVEDDHQESPRQPLKDLEIWHGGLVEVTEAGTFTDAFLQAANNDFDFYLLDTHLRFGDRKARLGNQSFNSTLSIVRGSLSAEQQRTLEGLGPLENYREGGLLLWQVASRRLKREGAAPRFIHYSADPSAQGNLSLLKNFGHDSSSSLRMFVPDKLIPAQLVKELLLDWAEEILRKEDVAPGRALQAVQEAVTQLSRFAERDKADLATVAWLAGEGGEILQRAGAQVLAPEEYATATGKWRVGYLFPAVGGLIQTVVRQAVEDRNARTDQLRQLHAGLRHIESMLGARAVPGALLIWYFLDGRAYHPENPDFGIYPVTHPMEQVDPPFKDLTVRDADLWRRQAGAVIDRIRRPETRKSIYLFTELAAALIRSRYQAGDIELDPAAGPADWLRALQYNLGAPEEAGDLRSLLGGGKPTLEFYRERYPWGGRNPSLSEILLVAERDFTEVFKEIVQEQARRQGSLSVDAWGPFVGKPNVVALFFLLAEAWKFRFRFSALDLAGRLGVPLEQVDVPWPLRAVFCETDRVLGVLGGLLANLKVHSLGAVSGKAFFAPSAQAVPQPDTARTLVVDLHAPEPLPAGTTWKSIFSSGSAGMLARLREDFDGQGAWFACNLHSEGGASEAHTVLPNAIIPESFPSQLDLPLGTHHLLCLPIPPLVRRKHERSKL